jgi:hypothetical protein
MLNRRMYHQGSTIGKSCDSNRKMEPNIRPEPDFAGYSVGSYSRHCEHYWRPGFRASLFSELACCNRNRPVRLSINQLSAIKRENYMH